ncbi:Tn3 family transposase [Tunturiibacter gelidoferens]|uniref:Tn3 family transposase n=1 Tax=Tunturiibacter gelidiferens TaxID=3069689 RepID=A0AAU7Z788_9BACT
MILVCVRWYCKYGITYRDLAEMMQERGVEVDASTIFRRAISYVNSGKFRVKTEAEQQIWNECSRLTASAIIYYNTLLLSRVYEQKLPAGDLEAIRILKSTSPVAWRNINLIGKFDFTSSSPVDIEALAARYQNEDFWRRSMTEGDEDGPQ